MINKKTGVLFIKRVSTLAFFMMLLCFSIHPLFAQTTETASSTHQLKPLRSDVGIIGLTANFNGLNKYTYLGQDTLTADSNKELEFVIRDVRMISPRLGVGFELLTSFFADGSNFGIGSWGLGPVLRAYPFRGGRLQPYVQAKALFGNNMGVGPLSDTKTGSKGFRVRLGLRGGFAYRITNGFGLFVDAGPDWESGRIFRSDARTLQINIGVDVYRFK